MPRPQLFLQYTRQTQHRAQRSTQLRLSCHAPRCSHSAHKHQARTSRASPKVHRRHASTIRVRRWRWNAKLAQVGGRNICGHGSPAVELCYCRRLKCNGYTVGPASLLMVRVWANLDLSCLKMRIMEYYFCFLCFRTSVTERESFGRRRRANSIIKKHVLKNQFRGWLRVKVILTDNQFMLMAWEQHIGP